MRRAVTAAVAACALAAGCTSSGAGGDTDGSTRDPAGAPPTSAAPDLPLEAPRGPGFYRPPDPLPGEPGDLLWAHRIGAPAGTRAWRVLYRSEAVDGTPIAVSGIVAAPAGPAPEGGRPVVSWAHGTTGAADSCAPSKERVVPWPLQTVVDAGYVGVATDYEGLGPPGLHPYLVGESEGRGVLDAARAARDLDGAGAGDEVVVWGVSQGGHAALFAGEIAPRYAPDLDVAGVVAAAPPGDLLALGAVATASPSYAPFVFWVAGGYRAAYGDVALDEFLTPPVIEELDAALEEDCDMGDFGYAHASEITRSPLDVDPWPRLLRQNSPGRVPAAMPLLVLQGADDQLVPQGLTDQLIERMCRQGTTVEYRVYPATRHGEEIAGNVGSALEWTRSRLRGERALSTCS